MTSVPAFVGCMGVLLGLVPSASLAERACPTVKNVDSSALRGDAAKDDWRVHRNAKSGLRFRYPPSMRVEERDPATFGLDEVPDAIVDLRGDGEHGRDFIVLRFICRPGRRTAAMAAARTRELARAVLAAASHRAPP